MSTVLSPADVDRIAALARLDLSDDERTIFAAQLTAILAYADQVQRADTSSIPGAIAEPPDGPRMRDDVPQASLDRDAALAQAPSADRAAGLFKVPRVLGS